MFGHIWALPVSVHEAQETVLARYLWQWYRFDLMSSPLSNDCQHAVTNEQVMYDLIPPEPRHSQTSSSFPSVGPSIRFPLETVPSFVSPDPGTPPDGDVF